MGNAFVDHTHIQLTRLSLVLATDITNPYQIVLLSSHNFGWDSINCVVVDYFHQTYSKCCIRQFDISISHSHQRYVT